VADALKRWETRLLLEQVTVAEVADEPARVRVEIHYRLRRSGVARRLALTVELEG